MTCDIDYRYRRALQPDGLCTFDAAFVALSEAIADAKLAGMTAGACPAVRLLTRHLQRIADGSAGTHGDEDRNLREACMQKLGELKNKPAIISLVKRGLDYRPDELRHYQREGQRVLRQIAVAMGLERSSYTISYHSRDRSLAGDHLLEARGVYVRISAERFGEPGVAWRNPYWRPPGAVMRKADIAVLADIPKLARRITSELKLATPAQGALI